MKEKQKTLLDEILSRKGLFIILLIIFFLLFRNIIWKAYDETVVDGLLCQIESHWIIDLLFLLLIAFTSISTIYLVKAKKRITDSFFYISLSLFLLFFYCRFFSEKYTFEHYTVFKSSNYIDYFLIFFGCVFLIKVASWVNNHKPPVYKQSPFLVDKPIEASGDDKFSRKTFAQKIAEKVQSKLLVEKAGALAIGINGPWGSGKTSFTNMINESIDEENRIVIDFNPWRSSSSSKIIEDFFELLITEIKPYDPSLSNRIAEYAKTLTKIEENIFTKSTEAIADFLFEEKSKNEIYDSINSSIQKIKKQIIIFIDDLDRLDKKEIIEVLRLIRNTANFNNLVYIVSYDKGYIQTAIKDFNEYNFRSFLEKIFQFEFTLPMYEHGILRTEIKKLLKSKLEGKFHDQIDRVVDSREFYGVNFTNEIVKTYRDVIRLANSILFEIESIKEEVFFYDFYLLQLLKLEYPKVYEALIENQYIFFTSEGEKGVYRLKTEKEAWTGEDLLSFSRMFKNNASNQPHQDEEIETSSFERYLNDNKESLALSEYDLQLLNYFVKTLLTLKEPKNKETDRDLYKSFAYPGNFHKYFAFRLYEGDLSAKEFEDFRRRDFDQYKQKVIEWIEEGKYSALIDRLEKVQDFSTITEFENHIRILFEIGRFQISQNKTYPYWLDFTLTIRNLKYPTEIPNTVRIYQDIDQYRQFLFDLFNNAPRPPLFESHVIGRIIGGHFNVALTFDELSQINLEYFKEYCRTHDEITQEFNQLSSNAVQVSNEYGRTYEKIPEANDLYLKYFKEKLTASQLNGFIRQTSPGHKYYYIDKEWLFKIFGDWTHFEEYLRESDNIKLQEECYAEFMEYYLKTKAYNYSAVEFNFNCLKVETFL